MLFRDISHTLPCFHTLLHSSQRWDILWRAEPLYCLPSVVHRKGTPMSRVLIMDDESIIRNSAGRVLSRMGHEVQYASHGEEVIALYQKAHATQRAFDVVILDLIIRDGMGGQEALAHLRRIDPHVKAIVSSGSTTDPAVLEYANHGFRAVLAKPYGKRELAAALQKVLEEP